MTQNRTERLRRLRDAIAGETQALVGFAASGDSVRGTIEALDAAGPLSIRDDGEALVIGEAVGEVVVLRAAQTGAEATGRGGRSEIVRRSANGLPAAVSLAYHDPERDYQTGLQRATVPPGISTK